MEEPKSTSTLGRYQLQTEKQQTKIENDRKEPKSIDNLTTTFSKPSQQSQQQDDKPHRKTRDEIVSLAINLPDGTLFKTTTNPTKTKFVSDILRMVCGKVGIESVDDYELVEISSNDIEKSIPLSDTLGSLAKKMKDGHNKLGIRKKQKNQLGQRKISFISASRNMNASKTQLISTTAANTVSTKGSSGEISSSPSGSNDLSSPATLKSLRPRRMSIQEGLSALLGFGSKQDIHSDSSPNVESNVEATPIFELEANERRMLHMQIPEAVSKIFTGVESHGLTFSRLAERNRFLSWSRSSGSSARGEISTKVFGVQLSTVMENEYLQDQTQKVPKFFESCLKYLENNALQVPGIFRISGVSKRIKGLKDDADAGKDLNFSEVKPHDVTGLIKLFFREMPEPLLTFKLYDFYISAARYLTDDKLDDAIRYLTLLLPICNLLILDTFLKLLDKVAQNSETTNATLPPYIRTSKDGNFSPSSTNEEQKEERPELKSCEDIDFKNDFAVDTSFPLSPSDMTLHLQDVPEGNFMTPSNLAIVVAPNILRQKDSKADKSLSDNECVTKVFERMLMIHESLFIVPADILSEVKQKMQS